MAVLVKPGVQFAIIAPKGFAILAAIERAAQGLVMDLTITSGTDGQHTSPGPHERGEAFDLRSKDLQPEMKAFLQYLLRRELGSGFAVLLEDPEGDNEHFHIQPRKQA